MNKIPVIFDWNDEQLVGEAKLTDGKMTIVVTEEELLANLNMILPAGTIKAVSIGFRVQHDIEYLPQTQE